MATALIAAARQRLRPLSEDANDDLGVFKQVPGKDERAIDLGINIRYNLRGYELFFPRMIALFLSQYKQSTNRLKYNMGRQGLEKTKSHRY